jgi:UDP-glucose 4-epimerase
MAKYLVTGGAGFIGSHLVRALVKAKHEVHVIDDLSNGDWDNLKGVQCVCIQDKIESAIMGTFDGIFHLATHPRYYSIEDPYTNIRTNMLGMANVLEYAKEMDVKVIFASNSGIVSNPETLPITEESPDEPTTPYDVTKLASEQLMKVYHKLFGVKGITLRFGTVYGERQRVNDELKWYPVLPTFVRDARQGKIWITGDGKQTRDFVYVGDVVNALILAMDSDIGDARKYLISGGAEYSLLDAHNLLQSIMGEEIQVEWREPLMGDMPRNWLDCMKANTELKWVPMTGLRKGLEKLIGL